MDELKVFVVEYHHRFGVDILIANDHETAEKIAVNLMIDNMFEIRDGERNSDPSNYERLARLIKNKEYEKAIALWASAVSDEQIDIYPRPVCDTIEIAIPEDWP